MKKTLLGVRVLALVVLATATAVAVLHCSSFESPAPVSGNEAGDGDTGTGVETSITPDGDTPDSVVPTCNADLATDPAHCGACDHACVNAACAAGVCAAELMDGVRTLLGPESHIAIRGAKGGLTDDHSSAGAGNPGFIYTFDPTVAKPVMNPGFSFQDHATLVAIGTASAAGGPHWTAQSGGPSNALDGQMAVGATITALAASPSGTALAARTLGGARMFNENLADQGTVTTGPGGPGLLFFDAVSLLVATNGGVDYCLIAGGMCGHPIPTAAPITRLALAGDTLVYATSTGELWRATLSPPPVTAGSPTMLLNGLVNVRAVAVVADAAYVLDEIGIHSTRHAKPLLVVPSTTSQTVFDFAVSESWIFFVRRDGVWRVGR
jgi:hypothetical protein